MDKLIKILHIEDDLTIQEITLLSLEIAGRFSVEQCSSGRVALSKASEYAPDLLLLDVRMPDMTGPETLRELRKLPGFEHKPAIFMTASAQPEEIKAYIEQGAIAVISKPFDPMTLAKQILDLWEQAAEKAKLNVIPLQKNPEKPMCNE
ncbi:MAG: response regulator [Pseudorhodobacter sp.]|nr:response regulator [Pseudorhodobacter sp.]